MNPQTPRSSREGGDEPEVEALAGWGDPTLSRQAKFSTYAAATDTPVMLPPLGYRVTQTLGVPSVGG